jgi:gamma-glutamylcyclotransferase (GGCT)/AIG2-like uncharacterized protein YtfP
LSSVAPLVSVFVYGTLKRGHRNHDRYCQGAVAIETARTLGRLYHLPQDYPMLEVPPASVLALGSSDGLADARRQHEARAPATDSSIVGEPASDSQNWLFIQGELITFDDPAQRLLALDRLEAYSPSERSGEYWRALVRLIEPAGALAWTYIAPNGKMPAGAAPCGDAWP